MVAPVCGLLLAPTDLERSEAGDLNLATRLELVGDDAVLRLRAENRVDDVLGILHREPGLLRYTFD
jgi:hypothetical protein